MAFFSDVWIDEVRARSDIAQVVQEYLPLKQVRARHWGLCPFHGEKTASFSVDAEKQLYYCFGCHAGGNVFQFIMEMERLEFGEAVRHLAERAHMEIPTQEAMPKGPSREKKDRLIAALTAAARWYNTNLYTPSGKASLDYLGKRGLGDRTIRHFGLGGTAQGWGTLKQVLEAQGFSAVEMEEAGLIKVQNTSSYDAFRERVMFPILDKRGRVVAFGGRILGEGQPKYLNSSDTPVFSKGKNIYGLNFIKGVQPVLYLMEGYMDVVSLYQHGVRNCVAGLGTALTIDQVRLLKRAAAQVVLVYDGDNAGQNATEKALRLFETEGQQVRVIVVPGGQDPDDYVRQRGAQAFKELPLLKAAQYRLKRAKQEVDLSTQEGRTLYAERAAAVLRGEESPLEIENYVKELMIETGFSKEVLYEQIGRRQPPKMKGEPFARTAVRRSIEKLIPDHMRAQQQLLSALAARRWPQEAQITIEDFTDPLCREIAQAILPGRGDPLIASRYVDGIDDDEMRGKVLSILSLEPACEPEQMPEMIRGYVKNIRLHALEEELFSLAEQMAAQRPQPEPEMIKEYTRLSDMLSNMKKEQ